MTQNQVESIQSAISALQNLSGKALQEALAQVLDRVVRY